MIKRPKTRKFLSPSLWNSFCRKSTFILCCLLGFVAAEKVEAVNISAVYSSACVRETGVIINVDENALQLMTLDGFIRNIPRFDIIYVATYPVGSIKIPEVVNPEDSEIITIKTVYQDQVVDMVEGWMIDYSEDQISFLTLSGTQTTIDTQDIWDIDITVSTGKVVFDSVETDQYEFVHPYPFMHCQKEVNGLVTAENPVHLIYPQHLLPEPLLIKKELDRLKEGYDQLRKYDNNKRFYPVPQIYGSDTTLGIWANLGNRYGSSRNRSNSFIPAIVSETNDGPFGFQSIFVTGSSPMFYSIHEEPQMQAYYKMKASYVHFSIMLDISRFTMGSEKYKWTPEDLETNDNRENEIFHMAGGFDYGSFALDVSIVNFVYYSIRHESEFFRDDMFLNKGSLSYHNRHLKMELNYGFATDSKDPPISLPDDATGPEAAYIEEYNAEQAAIPDFSTQFLIYRFNLELFNMGEFKPTYSLIYKSLDFEREENGEGEGEFVYNSRSLTNSLYISYPITRELLLSGYLSLELMEKEYGVTDLDEKSSHSYPKGGMSLALLF
jgi:hypothetical protein